MGAAEPRYLAHLLQVAIDHGRYAVARKPEHRLERMALSKHDWRAARHLQRLADVGGGHVVQESKITVTLVMLVFQLATCNPALQP